MIAKFILLFMSLLTALIVKNFYVYLSKKMPEPNLDLSEKIGKVVTYQVKGRF